MNKTSPANVADYIASFPKPTQKLLQEVRAIIRKTAPEAEEGISYQMPAYKYYGMLVYFAGYKNHLGFYPGAGGIAAFKKEIARYKNAKGSVQFPLDEPMPLELISKIVKFRVKQNEEKAKTKIRKPLKTVKEKDEGEGEFLASLSSPARRALENKKISTLKQLAKFSEAEILELHGMGPGSIPKLRSALKAAGLSFKKA